MQAEGVYPVYQLVEGRPQGVKVHFHVLSKKEHQKVPESHRDTFKADGYVVVYEGHVETHFATSDKSSKLSITKDTYVEFSSQVSDLSDYFGLTTDLLSCHKFTRKQKRPRSPKVYINKTTKDVERVLSLVHARNTNIQLCNGRGDEQGTPAFFEKLSREFATKHGLEIVVIRGNELEKEGFRLMHAVGRASKNEPIFINLKYHGNPDSDKWVAYVGKGVCFDSGGLNIKPTTGIKDMFLDKCGAVSVFTAFQQVIAEKLKINLTISMGFVENFVSSTSYRPSDVFTSRKGLTVQIGNTDAEGRLVLADCMNWTQEKYKTQVLIELSTLTGAIILALGHKQAGLFTNNRGLAKDLVKVGNQVHEQSWIMPLTDYHRDLVKHKVADITNHSGRTQAGSAQAAAFLQNFVEKDTKWIHLDIAGTSIVGGQGTGYGARLLLQYARHYASQ